MGFDIYGVKPEGDIIPDQPDWTKSRNNDEIKAYFAWQQNTPGAYFRNNVWWWRPLWQFVCTSCDGILTSVDIEEGQMNNGHRISKTKAKRIAAKIRSMDKKGLIRDYEYQWLDKEYPFNVKNVRDFAKFCDKSGGFDIC